MFIAALLCMAVVAHAINESHFHDERTCGTPALTPDEIKTETLIAKNFKENVCSAMPNNRICHSKTEKAREVTEVCLWMHVIYDPVTGNGNVSETMVQNQLNVFNTDFAGTNRQGDGEGGFQTSFQFNLEGVTRTGNRDWFLNIDQYEAQVTSALAVDPCRCQQVYFSQLSGGLLGYCYLPSSFSACSTRHGCFNHFETMPGGNYNNYNLGQTVTHEVGHGFGLYHVFQGAVCSGCGGDLVCDTNPQRTSTSGCPNNKDSCNDGLQDNYHNFMDYSYDDCMCEFTEGQSDRMDQQIAMYRPGYLGEAFKQEIVKADPTAYLEVEMYQAMNEAKGPKGYGPKQQQQQHVANSLN